MYISSVQIKNFRLLKNVESLSLDKETTVIVGRNNSGKTSLTELFKRLFASKNPYFKLEDFSLNSMVLFKMAHKSYSQGHSENTIRQILPSIELLLTINYSENLDNYGILSEFIIDFEEDSKEAKIKIIYKPEEGIGKALFSDYKEDESLFDYLKPRIRSAYVTQILAIDPTDENNQSVVTFSNLLRLIGVDFINAQRGLDDVTQNENDVLGSVLSNIFRSASSEGAPDEMKKKSEELQGVVDDIQLKVDTDFKRSVNELLPALEIFGYPGLADPKFTTETSFNAQTIIERNTRLKYEKLDGITLPESYNGLGSRNLIYILFQIFDFFQKYQSNPNRIENHIVFIEEPEAHLHPQMQEVFIRKLYEIANEFSKQLGENVKWPVQFIVSTHSTHIANEANFESIRYFLTRGEENPETTVKDLKHEFTKDELKEDREFVNKYLTLTKSDLFFADKAILIEGTSERILLPKFIEKVDEKIETNKLSRQFVSIIEVGGAYANHFYKFLDFLELRTLVITDIDSTKLSVTDNGNRYKVSPVFEGERTSNAGIINWFSDSDNPISFSELTSKTFDEKVVDNRRISFQIHEGEVDMTACGRSFEDAFIITNKKLFNLESANGNDLETKSFEEAKAFSSKKTDFAMRYALDETDWEVPLYIVEGLIWLSDKNEEITNSTEEE